MEEQQITQNNLMQDNQKAIAYLRHHMLWDQDERLSSVKVKKDGSVELKDSFEYPYMR